MPTTRTSAARPVCKAIHIRTKHSKHIETHDVATTILHSDKTKSLTALRRNKALKCKHHSTILEPKAKAEMEQQKAMDTTQKDETEQNCISPERYGGQAIIESIRKRWGRQVEKEEPS
jgi:hypothetical protein